MHIGVADQHGEYEAADEFEYGVLADFRPEDSGNGRAAPARLARKEWAEKVGLELKLPSLPLGIGQLGRLSEAKTNPRKRRNQ
jgi:hypothetical protein